MPVDRPSVGQRATGFVVCGLLACQRVEHDGDALDVVKASTLRFAARFH